MKLKVAQIEVAITFAKYDEDGEIARLLPSDPKVFNRKELKEFADGGIDEAVKATEAALRDAADQ